VAAGELAGAAGVHGDRHPVLAIGAVAAGVAALLARERRPLRAPIASTHGG
jgi:hypothetical protein